MVTKQQIAETIGVSRASVSQVLNDAPNARISPSVRQQILVAAAEMGYQNTKNLYKKQAHPTIAYALIHDKEGVILQSSWTTSLTASLQKVAQNDHRALLLLTATSDAVSIRKLIERLHQLRPLGIILDGQVPPALIEQLQKTKLPTVVTSNPWPNTQQNNITTNFDLVGVNVKDSVYQLLNHLAELGSKSIGLISSPLDMPFDRAILEAYKSWLKENNHAILPERVQICEQRETGVELLIRLRALNIHLDSLLFGSMDLARAIAAIFEYENAFHQTIGPRIAVLGNTEQHQGALKQTALCGCNVSSFAEAAYTLLASRINNTTRKPRSTNVPLHFLPAEF